MNETTIPSREQKPGQPVKLPVRKDREVQIKEMEIETVNRVISDEELKTQYTQSERLILPILKMLAKKPFSISQDIAEKRGIRFDFDKCRMLMFADMLDEYIRTGKALMRKGIGEDISVVSAYFQAQIERAKEASSRNIAGWEK